jgi:hypothetical protein
LDIRPASHEVCVNPTAPPDSTLSFGGAVVNNPRGQVTNRF